MKSNNLIWVLMGFIMFLLLLADVSLGKVDIPFSEVLRILGGSSQEITWSVIVLEARLPQALTAIGAGVGLSLSGLAMQTYFRNALAGPSVLGISSGASLGVALTVLISGGLAWAHTDLPVVFSAFLGAVLALFLILLVSRILRDSTSLLIFGMMFGFIAGALVSTLQFGADKEALRSFVFWGLGSFSQVRWSGLIWLYSGIFTGLALMILILPTLNLLLLGDENASGMGVKTDMVRNVLLLATGLMTAMVTAYCGPIAFLGLAVPHLARGFWHSSDHRVLLPAVLLLGAILGLLSDLVSRMPMADWSLPVNTVTSLIGAPVVIYILMKQRKRSQLI